MMTPTLLSAWLSWSAVRFAEKRDWLVELDTPIGDADHGRNMDRGFQKVAEQLPTWQNRELGSLLRSVGMTLLSTVGGASGPLYGTLFLRLASQAGSATALDGATLADAFAVAVDALAERGRAARGDKTMVDALEPAAETWKRCVDQQETWGHTLGRVTEAAAEGHDGTISLVAKRGRASYLGSRSMGHLDPGAASAHMLIEALRDADSSLRSR